jgi:cell division septum initiation protein DivIVA
MKPILLLMTAALLTAPGPARAQQDPAVDERLNKLSAQIQDLVDAKEAQNKRIDEMARQIQALQDQQTKPNASYASQADVKELAAKLQEVDRKRQEDNDLILKRIEGLGKTLSSSTKSLSPPAQASSTEAASPPPNSKGFEYEIKSGDSLWGIVQAYRAKNIKVSEDDILKANPGLRADRLRVGQKIFIPAPQ